MSKFVHLHNHTHYSLLDGLTKIDELVARAKEDGAEALAITDHGSMYGVIEFFEKCKKAGIKPIIGVETYLAPNSMLDKFTKDDERNYHLLLLAKDSTGYKNLIKLVSIAHLEGYYYKPRIDWPTLSKYKDGLIASTACLAGEIPQLIQAGNLAKAKKRILEYSQLFGSGNFYLEIQDHPELPEQKTTNLEIIKLARELDVPLLATNDIHYLDKDDYDAQDVLLCLQTKKKKEDKDRMEMHGRDFYYKSAKEMAEAFADVPEAIENTIKVAEACNLEIEFGQIHLPQFIVPAGSSETEYLRQLCHEGLLKRYNKTYAEIEPEKKERLNYELSVIEKMGWPSYFLIVADFVNWAKNNKIVVGPGRGSAAGSFVCYLTGVTDLDPLVYGLLFERFLNPDRISMPDIDLDFADIRRDEVIRYVEDKYGQDHVAQIITFGTMAARASVRDVGRVLNYPYDYCDKLAKMIPPMSKLKDALETVPELKEIYKQDEAARKILDYARRLEGVARHASTHACGVLITKEPLTEYVPLQYASSSDRNIVSQYSLHPIEDLGLLKMDFLGLKNLTIIESAIKIIRNTRGLEIDISRIPLDDKKAYGLFQDGETTGLFQFECLAGDTIVSNTTIKKLFEKQHKKRLEAVYLDEGRVHKNKILKVVQSGVKKVYTLIAENDRYIKASSNHNFLTENGWKKLKDLKPGDRILIKTKAKSLVYNTCRECGKQISGQYGGKSNFCYSCSAGFYKNPSKFESRTKIKKARINFFQNGGKPWNVGLSVDNSEIVKKTGAKISKALTGKTFEDYYGTEEANERKKKLSLRFSGKGNPMFGRPSPHRRGGHREDLGHYVRSTWEADFARILKHHKLEYEYEPRTFELRRQNGEIVHYTPDFFVPVQNTFYEIKGWMHDLDKEKIELFQKQYPGHNFILISATKFAEFALKYKELIAWECPQIPENSFEFIKIKEIKYSGREMTYDIAMQAPGNNFVANGFLVHNSSGMKRYLRELKPTEFEDLIAMVALYRPGPMEWIPDFIAGKHGKKKPKYLHPKLEPILSVTYGVAIYQEQVMQMARTIAGFSMAEADVLRKAVGKKIPKLLAEQKEKFIEGCVKNSVSTQLAEKIFSFIEPFAGYGFNRSHAACYALIAYQTAYLKANWPTEFMAALLASDQDDTDRIAVEIEECRKMGIEVMAPEINQSFGSFTVVTSGTAVNQTVGAEETPKTIRFGLKAIKNIGGNIAEAIIKERKENGPYADISDLLERVTDKDLNKKSLESLVKSGALDNFGERGELLANMDGLLAFNKEHTKNFSNGQTSLFADAPTILVKNKVKLKPSPAADPAEKLRWEKELLGLYVSEHPLNDYKNELAGIAMPLADLSKYPRETNVTAAGVVTSIKKIITRSNESMLFAKIEDQSASVEILVFPSLLKTTGAVWQEGKVIICQGRLSDKDQEVKLLAGKVAELNRNNLEAIAKEFKTGNPPVRQSNGWQNGLRPAPVARKNLGLIFSEDLSPDVLEGLKTALAGYPGPDKVYFKITGRGADKVIETAFRVDNRPALIESIKKLCGGSVSIVDNKS